MKTLAILHLLICSTALAFDPAGPPPKRTLEWTVHSLSHVKIPRVEFEDTLIVDAVVFASLPEIPKAYKVIVKISDEEAVRNKRINFKAKDITQIELLAAIAEVAGLDLLIQAGDAVLIPKSKIVEQEASAGQPASARESRAKGGDKPQPESEGRTQ